MSKRTSSKGKGTNTGTTELSLLFPILTQIIDLFM